MPACRFCGRLCGFMCGSCAVRQLLVQIVLWCSTGLPSLGIILDPFPAAVIVFSINEGAYCAETMRAALESVPVGQMEAGYCVGMSYLR